MALEIDLVAIVVFAFAVEKVVESNLVQRRGRRVGGNVTADAILLEVGSHHHGHGVPADEALEAAFNLSTTRVGGLIGDGDCIDVWRGGLERDLDAGL
jgi:hypothetical protein